jgi:hypothetical protein
MGEPAFFKGVRITEWTNLMVSPFKFQNNLSYGTTSFVYPICPFLFVSHFLFYTSIYLIQHYFKQKHSDAYLTSGKMSMPSLLYFAKCKTMDIRYIRGLPEYARDKLGKKTSYVDWSPIVF